MAQEQGLVQIYTGPGKGKTTAAVGLVVRALGWGKRVYVCQFLKPAGVKSGEMCLTEKFSDQLTWQRIENGWPLVKGGPDKATREKMSRAIAETWPGIVELTSQGKYDLVILDELTCCLSERLIEWPDVENLIRSKHPRVELVVTGRDAPAELIEAADLVSEITEVKHPFTNGQRARKGIEY